EQHKVELWAKAINSKSDVVKHTQEFYDYVAENENVRLQKFIEAYKTIMSQNLDADLNSPRLSFYTKVIMDNKSIPVIITDEFNNITFTQNVETDKNQKLLAGELLKKFSVNKPFEYEVYGMKFRLYYTQSVAYTNMRKVLDDVSNVLLNEITENTILVPVIITDSSRSKIYVSGNIPLSRLTEQNKQQTIKDMTEDATPIEISMIDGNKGYIYYKKSPTLTILKYYPLLYFFVLLIALALFFMVFRTMKIAEQNNVWIGMSKETAHQLGTPISSLMAWTELLKMNPDNEVTCKEIDKDIQRLNLISQRFSQIGSHPDLKVQDITILIYNTVSYMQLRVPKKVNITVDVPLVDPIEMPLNKPLFEWTIENLIKNSVDAMEGNGKVIINLQDMGSHIHLDISDTGKGISRNQFKSIFKPGFTTKKRGWGMGLSLVKRIIEEYHNGKIYVKSSTPNVITTFRIELPKK
ncbi:MAG: HAMP domain-containing histidine kinase, partial [Bacteroidales bacterium]|nr:HAMP domain-containing histidine kinase [Bacteroidales bacterium]